MQPSGFDGSSPRVTYRHDGVDYELDCDVIVGADGYHGVCRRSIPAGGIEVFEREYPFGWLGILANVAPSTDDLIYALHPSGFAMHSMRSTSVSRLYVQVNPDESIDDWSDARIWDELQTRLGIDGWTLHEGEVTEKSITPDAQLRRVDAALGSPLPRRGCRAHRAADRRQGPQLGDRGCRAARAGDPRPPRGRRHRPRPLQRPRAARGSGRCSSSRSG